MRAVWTFPALAAEIRRSNRPKGQQGPRGRTLCVKLSGRRRRTAARAGPALAQQKSVKIGFVWTFSGPIAVIGNNMRNSFELALDHIGRKMGGLPVEVIYEDDGHQARGRQAEDREADRVRQGRFHRRLHLVERAARFAQAGGEFEDLPDHRQCRPLADRRRTVLPLCLLDLMAERPDAAGDGPVHEPEGREDASS